MATDESVNALLELSIKAEKTALDFFGGLALKFSSHPSISDFWKSMQADESEHLQMLQNIKSVLTPQQLSQPVAPDVMWKAKQILSISVAGLLRDIATLDDAYECAHDLEFSEINTVFSFILQKYAPDEDRKALVKLQIKQHQQKLIDFTSNFGDARWRKCILAVE